ncbi:response regulator transcription factor [Defluviitalea saccharophila]|uniref:Stage 0 sporulation protein A homolog n=1 Tax=Defluviitalea saccharophila TaxID=879970 RepID=A0ABZ2Y409_9FIRM|nr:response regulator [Candidatus Epulonipiscium sp.]
MHKVLIVEDEDIMRKGLMFMPKWQEVNCIVVGEACNGLDGLEKIQKLQPDIVIVDINMPVMDGLEMLEKSIREYGYDAIIVSGYGEFDYARRGISLGVTEYLLKPINYTKLYEAIRKIEAKRNVKESMKNTIRQIDVEKKKLGLLEHEDTKTGNRYVDLMLQAIHEKYATRLALTDISEECQMSCTYLNVKFKNETGYTFNDYLNRYRIQKAVDLLRENKYKIYEIAEMVGFSDYKYFIKVFKKYIGHSPARFLSEN